MRAKKIALNISLVLFFAVLLYGTEIVLYYMNRTFIEANIGALPFTYQIMLDFFEFRWWAIVLAILSGLIVRFYIGDIWRRM